ncbi:MAG TPA: AI-2E family transporter [Abditibacteriaceae bacterium]|jgi:predicted PurR-regulated permease PerM
MSTQEASGSANHPLGGEGWSNRRIFFVLALGTLIVSIIWHAPQEATYISERTGEIFFTLVLAMSLTYLMRPGVRALNKMSLFGSGSRTGRTWATAVVFVATGLLLYLFVAIGLRPFVRDAGALKDYFVAMDETQRKELINQWQTKLDTAIKPYMDVIAPGRNIRIDRDVPRAITNFAPRAQKWLANAFTHIGFIVELLLVPVLVFYFLSDGPAIRQEARLLCPPVWRARGARMLADLDRVLDGYIRGQVIMCVIAWIAVTLGLWALRIPHAFTMGLIAGLTRAVPVIGPLLGAIPIVLLCLFTTNVQTTVIVLFGFIAMHFLESKVLLPKIVGHEVDLHPVSVIVALLLGMEFFGFLGVFLAVPVAAVLKISLAEWHNSRVQTEAIAAGTAVAVADKPNTPQANTPEANAREAAIVDLVPSTQVVSATRTDAARTDATVKQ